MQSIDDTGVFSRADSWRAWGSLIDVCPKGGLLLLKNAVISEPLSLSKTERAAQLSGGAAHRWRAVMELVNLVCEAQLDDKVWVSIDQRTDKVSRASCVGVGLGLCLLRLPAEAVQLMACFRTLFIVPDLLNDLDNIAGGTAMRNTPSLLMFLFAIALTASCTGSNQSDQSSANAVQSPHSLNSDIPALITFVNRSNQAVNVYWLDFGGNRKLYQTLEAGGSYTQQTYLTHPWLVADASGRPWNVYMPQARPQTIYLQTPGAALVAR